MDNRTWEQTGKGQYELKNVPYTGYNAKPGKQTQKRGGFFLFIAGLAAGILILSLIHI